MDCKIGFEGWHLMLDSDMLFLKQPIELEEWLKNPQINIYMQDIYCMYQYSFGLLSKVLNKEIKGFVNSGVVGINNSNIDWDELEKWTQQLIESEGLNYFFEQTMHALYFTKYESKNLDENNYFIIPSKNK